MISILTKIVVIMIFSKTSCPVIWSVLFQMFRCERRTPGAAVRPPVPVSPTHPDLVVLEEGHEDVGGEGGGAVQTALQLGVDDPARLQVAAVRAQLAAQPAGRAGQHPGVDGDEPPGRQEAPQHKRREPERRGGGA